METKTTWAGVAVLIVGAVVQAVQEQGVTVEAVVAAAVPALVGLAVGWLKANGNLAPSTREAAATE